MWVLAGEQFACIKLSGRANFSSSVDFKTVVQELRQKGCTYFVLDLSECTLMDSTFLGVLAGLGLQSKPAEGDQPKVVLELLNPNERVTELLESLGVLHLFNLSHGAAQMPQPIEAQAVTTACPGKDEVRKACLEAHKTLMELNPQNASRFKEVAVFLSEDLKKSRPGP